MIPLSLLLNKLKAQEATVNTLSLVSRFKQAVLKP